MTRVLCLHSGSSESLQLLRMADAPLAEAGVSLAFHDVGLGNLFDLRRVRATRKLLASFQPDIIHAIGVDGLIASRLAGVRVVASEVDDLGSGWKQWFGRRLRKRAEAVTLPLAVDFSWTSPQRKQGAILAPLLALRASEEYIILFGGSLTADCEPIQAAWAFDVLKYVDPRLQLVFVGDGPEKARVEALAHSLGWDDLRTHFQTECSNAAVAWFTQPHGGALAALQVLASGCPVIAMRNPDLAELPAHFVEAGDRVGLAAATKKFFEVGDPLRVDQDALAARFPLRRLVETLENVYRIRGS